MVLIKKRKLNDYKIQLAIAQNPHSKNPKELWDILNSEESPEMRDDKFDNTGFEILKERMRSNPRMMVK